MSDAAKPRRELPLDPWLLEPMGADFDEAIERGLAELGLLGSAAAGDIARRTYEAHARLLREWNQAINLTAIREPGEIARRHVIDSLSALPLLSELARPRATLLDIGSGGGYPGLPLAATLPLSYVGLLDSVGKKARFLDAAGQAVAAVLAEASSGEGETGEGEAHEARDERAVVDIEAIGERAEAATDEHGMREAFDIVISRAVGSLAEVLELSLPLTRVGGTVVAWKREEEGGGLREELRNAGSIIRAAGGGRPRVVAVEAESLPGHRLVALAKERATPRAYPRPAGVRKHRRR